MEQGNDRQLAFRTECGLLGRDVPDYGPAAMNSFNIEAMQDAQKLTRDDLKTWEARAVHLALRQIVNSYEAAGFSWIADLDLACLSEKLRDAVSDATFPVWTELDGPRVNTDSKFENVGEGR
jgi:hypothetical protein